MSAVAVTALKALEGVRTECYWDEAGLCTLGVGHFLTRSEVMSGKVAIGERVVAWKDGLTLEQVEGLLRDDLFDAESTVRQAVHVRLTQHQFDALVLWVFNVGPAAAARSTLVRLLNRGDYASVPEQLRRWVYAAGHISAGLRARREREIALWEGRWP